MQLWSLAWDAIFITYSDIVKYWFLKTLNFRTSHISNQPFVSQTVHFYPLFVEMPDLSTHSGFHRIFALGFFAYLFSHYIPRWTIITVATVPSTATVCKFESRLELWPGYATSIMPYETDVLLSADVSHKVLRQTTVLEYLYDLYRTESRDFHGTAVKKLVGQIILTRYNYWFKCTLNTSCFQIYSIIKINDNCSFSKSHEFFWLLWT